MILYGFYTEPTLPVPTGSAASLVTSPSHTTNLSISQQNASRSTQSGPNVVFSDMGGSGSNIQIDQLSIAADRGDANTIENRTNGANTFATERSQTHTTREITNDMRVYSEALSPSSAKNSKMSFTNISNMATKEHVSQTRMTSQSSSQANIEDD